MDIVLIPDPAKPGERKRIQDAEDIALVHDAHAYRHANLLRVLLKVYVYSAKLPCYIRGRLGRLVELSDLYVSPSGWILQFGNGREYYRIAVDPDTDFPIDVGVNKATEIIVYLSCLAYAEKKKQEAAEIIKEADAFMHTVPDPRILGNQLCIDTTNAFVVKESYGSYLNMHGGYGSYDGARIFKSIEEAERVIEAMSSFFNKENTSIEPY